jgi:hypothetical protein
LRLAPAVAAGLVLRLHALPGQILLDDEWHALNFVIGKPFFSLLWRQGEGANCIPQNIYTGLLLRTAGWSETALRLPSVVFGLLSLLVLPRLVRRLWGEPVALAFAWLLAISPCAVFYARLCRPFAGVLFLGFLSLCWFVSWTRERRKEMRFGWAFAAFGALYLHLYAVVFVLPPLFLAMAARALKDGGRLRASLPSYRESLEAGFIVAILIALFIVPPTIVNPFWLGRSFHGFPGANPATAAKLWSLICGTASVPAQAALAAGAVWGFLLIAREDPAAAAAIGAGIACYALKVVSSRQQGMDAAIELARYGIILFPVCHLAWAFALSRAARALPAALGPLVPAAAALALFALGPLRQTYAAPNDFTNHSAFQDDYAPIDWARSRERALHKDLTTSRELVPQAYGTSAVSEAKGVIEYPMFVGDELNVYYYYQHFHRKPVAIGYVAGVPYAPLESGEDFVYGNTPVNYILGRAAPERLKLKKFVDLADAGRLRQEFAGWDIVLHRHLLAEAFPGKARPGPAPWNPAVERALSDLRAAGFSTVAETPALTVLRVP